MKLNTTCKSHTFVTFPLLPGWLAICRFLWMSETVLELLKTSPNLVVDMGSGGFMAN
jgi:hypothetical protein